MDPVKQANIIHLFGDLFSVQHWSQKKSERRHLHTMALPATMQRQAWPQLS
jgi:hypothetical protein